MNEQISSELSVLLGQESDEAFRLHLFLRKPPRVLERRSVRDREGSLSAFIEAEQLSSLFALTDEGVQLSALARSYVDEISAIVVERLGAPHIHVPLRP